MKNIGSEISATELHTKSLQNSLSGLSTPADQNSKLLQNHANEANISPNSPKNQEIKKSKDFQMEM